MLRTLSSLTVIFALGLALAGCDSCGDLFGTFKNPFERSPKSCHSDWKPR